MYKITDNKVAELLTGKNDRGVTFKEIADIIEENYENL